MNENPRLFLKPDTLLRKEILDFFPDGLPVTYVLPVTYIQIEGEDRPCYELALDRLTFEQIIALAQVNFRERQNEPEYCPVSAFSQLLEGLAIPCHFGDRIEYTENGKQVAFNLIEEEDNDEELAPEMQQIRHFLEGVRQALM